MPSFIQFPPTEYVVPSNIRKPSYWKWSSWNSWFTNIYPLNKGGSFHSFWCDQLGYITSSMVGGSFREFRNLSWGFNQKNFVVSHFLGWMTINNQQTALHKKTNNSTQSKAYCKRLKPTETIPKPSRRKTTREFHPIPSHHPIITRLATLGSAVSGPFHPRDGARCRAVRRTSTRKSMKSMIERER